MGPLVVIGANGQLGSDLVRKLAASREVLPLKRSDFDVRNLEQAAAVLTDLQPAVIVNTAAFHKVEQCEQDAEQSFAVNAIGVRNLAELAGSLGSFLVHFSTDYVFSGGQTTPYDESATPDPVNVYGTSKVAGELFIRSITARHLIIRTSGLYGVAGSSGKGGNFVQTMLRLGREKGLVTVVDDQRLSPTYTADLAEKVAALIDARAEGTFHVTNSDSCSWFEFAKGIFEAAGMRVEVVPAKTSDSAAKVRRPRYSVLSNRRLAEAGFEPLRPWREAVADYLNANAAVNA